MFKNILVLTDGSELSRMAVEKAVQLAKSVGAKVTGLTVAQPSNEPHGTGTLMLGGRVVEDAANEFVKDVRRIADEAGVPCECFTVVADVVHSAAVATAESRGCDLICMATHGRSQLGKLFFGSQLTGILHECRIPVLVFR